MEAVCWKFKLSFLFSLSLFSHKKKDLPSLSNFVHLSTSTEHYGRGLKKKKGGGPISNCFLQYSTMHLFNASQAIRITGEERRGNKATLHVCVRPSVNPQPIPSRENEFKHFNTHQLLSLSLPLTRTDLRELVGWVGGRKRARHAVAPEGLLLFVPNSQDL